MATNVATVTDPMKVSLPVDKEAGSKGKEKKTKHKVSEVDRSAAYMAKVPEGASCSGAATGGSSTVRRAPRSTADTAAGTGKRKF